MLTPDSSLPAIPAQRAGIAASLPQTLAWLLKMCYHLIDQINRG